MTVTTKLSMVAVLAMLIAAPAAAAQLPATGGDYYAPISTSAWTRTRGMEMPEKVAASGLDPMARTR